MSQDRDSNIDQRFDRIDMRLDHIDTQLERFNSVEAKLEQFRENFVRIDEKFDRIDRKFDRIDEKFDRINETFDRHDELMGSLVEAMNDGFSRVYRYMDIVREDIRSDFRALTETLLDQGTRISCLEDSDKGKTEQLKMLEHRVGHLEKRAS